MSVWLRGVLARVACILRHGEFEGAQTRHDGCKPTFREEAAAAIDQMLAQVPAISKLVVTLQQFDTVAFRQAQLIGAAGLKVVWEGG